MLLMFILYRKTEQKNKPEGCFIRGGGGWIWTNDLLVMGQTSYQAALPRDDM